MFGVAGARLMVAALLTAMPVAVACLIPQRRVTDAVMNLVGGGGRCARRS